MAVIVQKYGGTSVGSIELIEAVADNIIATRRKGHQVVAVLSAMEGETNKLLSMAMTIDKQPASRELDMLLSSAEQVSISLLTIALVQRGFSAISLLAHQVGIKTDNHFGRARIQSVDSKRMLLALEQEQVVVVAGFQGHDQEHNVTTLGRGGSDTSAVAIAAALKASECQIFTDVDGIYSADPRIEPLAKKREYIAFNEMLVMASLGAKVLQNRAVEYAMLHNMPIRVLSSFKSGQGTKVMSEVDLTSESILTQTVSNIAHHAEEAFFVINDIEDSETISEIYTELGKAGIELDMINQQMLTNGYFCVSFSIHRKDYVSSYQLLQNIAKKSAIGTIQGNDKVAKISAIGIGMKSHAGIAGLFFSALTKQKINIQLVSSSEISLSVLVDESYLIKSVRELHRTFS